MNPGLVISFVGLAISIAAFVLSRIVLRRVRVRVHRAFFDGGQECYFVNVTNVSLNREVEVTHVWFDLSPRVHVIRPERPLPKRLKTDETWETWATVAQFPASVTDAEVYRLARVRLSNGKEFRSKENKRVPPVGLVAGINS